MMKIISTIIQRDDCGDLVPTISDLEVEGFKEGEKVTVII